MKSSISVLWMALLLLTSCAKITVVQVTPATKPTAEGVFYALPKTVVKAQVKVDKTTVTPAPYQKFAAIFAPDGTPVCKQPDCVDERKKVYSVQKNATLGTFGVPDPNHIYLVKFGNRGLLDQQFTMAWNESGLPSTATASVTNKTGDVILSSFKAAAGLGMKAAGFGGGEAKVEGIVNCIETSPNDEWVKETLTGSKLGAQVVPLYENWCAIEKEDRDRFNKSTDQPLLQKAAGAYAARLLDLMVAHAGILQANKLPFEPGNLLTRLDALIDQQLKTLFLGQKQTATWELTMNLTPGNAPGSTTAFKWNPEKGVCPVAELIAPDSAARPAAFTVAETADCTVALEIETTYQPKQDDQLFYSAKNNTTEPKGEASFRYRIPAQVQATVKSGTTLHASAVFAVAQMGHVATLPAKRNSKQIGYDLAFIEATGGLKSFKLTTTGGLDSGVIDSASGIAGSVLDARAKENLKSDELTLLKRELDLADTKKKICEALRALNQPCPYTQQ